MEAFCQGELGLADLGLTWSRRAISAILPNSHAYICAHFVDCALPEAFGAGSSTCARGTNTAFRTTARTTTRPAEEDWCNDSRDPNSNGQVETGSRVRSAWLAGLDRYRRFRLYLE